MKYLSRKMQAHRMHAGMRGMTLIELLIVVVIIGILAAIAYPSFQEQVRKTRRADGKAMLMEKAQELERCYTRVATYVGCGDDTVPSQEGYYEISVDTPTANTFTLTATPQGDQANDAKCDALTYANDGVQGSSGTADSDDCW